MDEVKIMKLIEVIILLMIIIVCGLILQKILKHLHEFSNSNETQNTHNFRTIEISIETYLTRAVFKIKTDT